MFIRWTDESSVEQRTIAIRVWLQESTTYTSKYMHFYKVRKMIWFTTRSVIIESTRFQLPSFLESKWLKALRNDSRLCRFCSPPLLGMHASWASAFENYWTQHSPSRTSAALGDMVLFVEGSLGASFEYLWCSPHVKHIIRALFAGTGRPSLYYF